MNICMYICTYIPTIRVIAMKSTVLIKYDHCNYHYCMVMLCAKIRVVGHAAPKLVWHTFILR